MVASDEFVISRLRQVLRRLKGERGWQKLSDEIYELGNSNKDARIPRRSLAKLSGDDYGAVKLSITQLIALDRLFVANGEGPLFLRTDTSWTR